MQIYVEFADQCGSHFPMWFSYIFSSITYIMINCFLLKFKKKKGISNQNQHPLNLINFSCSWPGKEAPANCKPLLNSRSAGVFWSLLGRALIFVPHIWALQRLSQQIKKGNVKFRAATKCMHRTAEYSPDTSKDPLDITCGQQEQHWVTLQPAGTIAAIMVSLPLPALTAGNWVLLGNLDILATKMAVLNVAWPTRSGGESQLFAFAHFYGLILLLWHYYYFFLIPLFSFYWIRQTGERRGGKYMKWHGFSVLWYIFQLLHH